MKQLEKFAIPQSLKYFSLNSNCYVLYTAWKNMEKVELVHRGAYKNVTT